MNKKLKEYLISCVIVYGLFFTIISVAIGIICIPALREGFCNFFNCKPMTWGQARIVLFLDYFIAIPFSFLYGSMLKVVLFE
jgi:hypothetical protein